MCDLIDLKSPDGKSVPGAKLASPLIPAPLQADKDPRSPSSPSCNFAKRTSLDNNPFDDAHRETVEYMRKQEDPFEVALQKALAHERRKPNSAASKACCVDFKDDFTPKKKRYADILKMNKTLDDSATDLRVEASVVAVESENVDAKSRLAGGTVPHIRVESTGMDSSILNQSAMNDSLTESTGGPPVDDGLLRSVLGLKINERLRCAAGEATFLIASDEIPKLQNLRRSLSQGDKAARKIRPQRSYSTADGATLAPDDSSFVSTTPSIVFDDIMNKAFSRSLSRCDISSLSNVSSIARVTPVPLLSSSNSSAFSDRTANRAFVEGSNGSGTTRWYGQFGEGDISLSGRLGSKGSSAEKTPREDTQGGKDSSELIAKYTEVRRMSECTKNETRTSSVVGLSEITGAKSAFRAEDKLIDADIFVPRLNGSPDSFQRKSVSSTSSDSVFVDSDTIEKSIFSEAKSLAKTFEELAGKTGSSSISSDDLVNSRPRWNFDALPPSDDEAMDLIELQKSPERSERPNVPEESQKSTSPSDANSDNSTSKEFDTKFRDPENKLIASTLLMDLEKLVKSEANAEAAALLKNLEKALDVKCGSNVDLLTTYLGERSDSRSPERSEIIGETENIEKGQNNEVDSSEIVEKTSPSDDKFNVENRTESPVPVNDEHDRLSGENGSENVSLDSSEKMNCSMEAVKQRNHITDDQKVAAEILVGLGKLLSGEKKDPTMGSLLKNLGIALNLAFSNNCDQHHSVGTDVKKTERLVTPVKNRIPTPPRRSTALSVFSKTSNRRSLSLNIKTNSTNERGVRKSTSVSQTPTSTTPSISRLSNTLLSADKSKAYLKDGRKRFPSDPTSDFQSISARKLTKDISLKTATISELARQEKPSSTVVGTVKNRLKKKTESVTANKKGPMKATLPLGNMQRQGSLVKRDSPLNGSVTPPKPGQRTPSPFAVSTSTPFPVVHLAIPPKKSPKTKPVASSTPDDVGPKNLRRSASQIPQSPGRSAFSCNISPVTSKRTEANDHKTAHNNSTSSRTSKIGTPSKSRQTSHLPKMSPVLGNKNASDKVNRSQRRSEPLQSVLPKSSATPKTPALRRGSDSATSPLNDSNKFGSTVKPLNLISKLGRRKAGLAEKENHA